MRSVTSVRTVNTKRSAKQFARGHRGGILTTSMAAAPGLRRVIGPGLLLFFVVGDILDVGIYALVGSVAARIGGALWLPFLLAFIVAFLTALSYLELVGKYPRAAGAALYTQLAFGVRFLTFMVAFAVMASGVTSAASAATASARSCNCFASAPVANGFGGFQRRPPGPTGMRAGSRQRTRRGPPTPLAHASPRQR